LIVRKIHATLVLSGGDVSETKAAQVIAVGSMVVAVLAMWYSTGVGDALVGLWRSM
jgi:hypothetical protein